MPASTRCPAGTGRSDRSQPREGSCTRRADSRRCIVHRDPATHPFGTPAGRPVRRVGPTGRRATSWTGRHCDCANAARRFKGVPGHRRCRRSPGADGEGAGRRLLAMARSRAAAVRRERPRVPAARPLPLQRPFRSARPPAGPGTPGRPRARAGVPGGPPPGERRPASRGGARHRRMAQARMAGARRAGRLRQPDREA